MLKKYFLLSVLLLTFSGFSQDNQEIIFVECAEADNPEECSFLKISELISTRLNTASLPYSVGENEQLILSMRLFFSSEGNLSSSGSIIYNTKEKTYLEFESVIKDIPKVQPKLNSKGNPNSQSLTAVLIYKFNSGKFSVVKFTKDLQPEFEITMRYPVYPKCKSDSDISKVVKCFKKKLDKHIAKNFKTENLNNLQYYSGQTIRAVAYFELTSQGTIRIKNIEANNESSLENEVKRVLSSIPRMTEPGYIGPKPISVPYRLPIALSY